jgi:hypothetical protein
MRGSQLIAAFPVTKESFASVACAARTIPPELCSPYRQTRPVRIVELGRSEVLTAWPAREALMTHQRLYQATSAPRLLLRPSQGSEPHPGQGSRGREPDAIIRRHRPNPR